VYYQAHTILLNLSTVVLYAVVVSIRRDPGLGKFALLGIVAGFGLLSKFSFVAILGSVFLAALLVKEYRTALFRPAAAATVAGMLLVAAPSYIALAGMLGGSVYLPRIVQEVFDPGMPFAQRSAVGAWKLFKEYILQGLPLLAAVTAIWGTAIPGADLRLARSNADFRFFAVQAAAALGLTMLAVVAMGIDGVTHHHPVPLLLALPIAAVLAADSSGIFDQPKAWLREWFFVGLAALAVPVIWLALLWSLLNVFPDEHLRYAPLAREIRATGGEDATVIVTSSFAAGQLRIQEPGFTIFVSDLANRVSGLPRTPGRGGCVAVWPAGASSTPPHPFVSYVESVTGIAWSDPGGASQMVESTGAPTVAWRVESLPPSGHCGSGS
jgi:hypothetical protein